ncbi:hypothetical protein [Buttiauxella massiliensis]|uniref:hypothetical protein n=1 Tax=Buttiauxella massiliensis TaxID=2831590 RepID=UPI00186A3D2D|nr:hypothetical protein [Buttiauxella massiliensis]
MDEKTPPEESGVDTQNNSSCRKGGKHDNPNELTQASDLGERVQPTHLRLEV